MFIPPLYQVAFINVISVFWSTYLSYMKNHKVVELVNDQLDS
jgi:hypothetical protein